MKMTEVCGRKLGVFNKVTKIITEFYAFIIIKKLKEINKIKDFRTVENLVKTNIKIYSFLTLFQAYIFQVKFLLRFFFSLYRQFD